MALRHAICKLGPLLAGLVIVSPAAAAVTSSNWAGYAATGASFKRISATWIQPAVSCVAGRRSFSAAWIGLGGYETSSTALEQVGTEADCATSGRAVYYAWYELVPAPEATVRLAVRAGDTISASVTVSGRAVRLRIVDDTRRRSFSKLLRVRQVDTSSAEWIVEAPSACAKGGACATLPLADFGRTAFARARAKTFSGHVGSVSDVAWTTTAILLAADGRPLGRGGFVANAGFAQATPGALSAFGDAFVVSYSAASGQGGPSLG